MSAILCPTFGDNYVRAASMADFFNNKRDEQRIASWELREKPGRCHPSGSCEKNLFFGFFFDGTRNNYAADAPSRTESNVARLYDIYPGIAVPNVLPDSTKWKKEADPNFSNFFRVYVPGVATRFDHVEDSGTGLVKTLGGAMGKEGESRIAWALIQAINNVHRFFYNRPLLSAEETTDLATELVLSRFSRALMTKPDLSLRDYLNVTIVRPRTAFAHLLKRLHASVAQHWSIGGRPPAKLNPGIVKTIYISTFGFSRGSTQARAFANWLDSLTRLDAMLRGRPGRSLGGFPVEFDFLGLFDTVASVGPGNTYGNALLAQFIDGHNGWADAEESLRIPACIKKCVHLAAGHELRRSFPLDSVSVGATLPPNAEEYVFPGVHSDVGGGYGPKQHGKGVHDNGNDMLSRLPLLFMYRQARLFGVPLKLNLADKTVQDKFAVEAKVIKDVNAYLSKCTKKSGALTDVMREQQILQMGWRYYRRDNGPAPLHKQANFVRASTFDKNDLDSANKEFNAELREFEKAMKTTWTRRMPQKQDPGFDNSVSREWEEIATYWPFREPDPVVAHFFDEYVHDSRAAFKLGPADNPKDEVNTLQSWVAQLNARKLLHKNPLSTIRGARVPGPPDYGMDTNQRIAAEAFERARRANPAERDLTKLIPRYINEGREPSTFADAGYFRFRKIYGGSDDVLLSHWKPIGLDQDRALASLSAGMSGEVPVSPKAGMT